MESCQTPRRSNRGQKRSVWQTRQRHSRNSSCPRAILHHFRPLNNVFAFSGSKGFSTKRKGKLCQTVARTRKEGAGEWRWPAEWTYPPCTSGPHRWPWDTSTPVHYHKHYRKYRQLRADQSSAHAVLLVLKRRSLYSRGSMGSEMQNRTWANCRLGLQRQTCAYAQRKYRKNSAGKWQRKGHVHIIEKVCSTVSTMELLMTKNSTNDTNSRPKQNKKTNATKSRKVSSNVREGIYSHKSQQVYYGKNLIARHLWNDIVVTRKMGGAVFAAPYLCATKVCFEQHAHD